MPEMSADILKDFLTEPKEAGYRPVSLYQSEITRAEALSDLEELQYLMDNRYCGKDYYIVIESRTETVAVGEQQRCRFTAAGPMRSFNIHICTSYRGMPERCFAGFYNGKEKAVQKYVFYLLGFVLKKLY